MSYSRENPASFWHYLFSSAHTECRFVPICIPVAISDYRQNYTIRIIDSTQSFSRVALFTATLRTECNLASGIGFGTTSQNATQPPDPRAAGAGVRALHSTLITTRKHSSYFSFCVIVYAIPTYRCWEPTNGLAIRTQYVGISAYVDAWAEDIGSPYQGLRCQS